MENGSRIPSKIPRPFSKPSSHSNQNSNTTNSNSNTSNINESINYSSTQDLDQSAFSPFIRTPVTNQSMRYSYSPVTPGPNGKVLLIST